MKKLLITLLIVAGSAVSEGFVISAKTLTQNGCKVENLMM